MKILFMCVANSARSQLAHGIAKRLFPSAEVESAGSSPGTLNPFGVQVMKEVGIDISHHYSKSVDDLPRSFVSSVDYVITLCAEEVCPAMVTKAKRLHWPFSDPASKESLSAEEMISRFRVTRDLIYAKLNEFKKEIIG